MNARLHAGAAACALMVATIAQAATDPRFQEVVFDATSIVEVHTRYGFATHIVLDADEFIVDAASGDGEHWNVVARHGDHHVYLKPMANAQATNLLVTTDRRSYAFALSVGHDRGVYLMQFRYPSDAQTHPQREQRSAHNDAYTYQAGLHSTAIVPVAAYDDHVFTYLRMAAGSPVPAVFARADDDSESIVNSHMDGELIVLHGVYRRLLIRLGSMVVGVWNEEGAPTAQRPAFAAASAADPSVGAP